MCARFCLQTFRIQGRLKKAIPCGYTLLPEHDLESSVVKDHLKNFRGKKYAIVIALLLVLPCRKRAIEARCIKNNEATRRCKWGEKASQEDETKRRETENSTLSQEVSYHSVVRVQ